MTRQAISLPCEILHKTARYESNLIPLALFMMKTVTLLIKSKPKSADSKIKFNKNCHCKQV